MGFSVYIQRRQRKSKARCKLLHIHLFLLSSVRNHKLHVSSVSKQLGARQMENSSFLHDNARGEARETRLFGEWLA